MRRPAIVLSIVLVAAFVLCLASCAPRDSAPAPETPAEPRPAEGAAEPDRGDEAMRRLNVQVYFPFADGDGLIGEPHEIFMTTAPGDRAKQILADLISGPVTELAMRALPPGTQLRQVYVLEQGTAYVDFSADLKQGLGGGSTEELFAVYSIVNSVALNIPEIRRVGILIDGRPVETLNGHLDLRRPLSPDMSIISGATQPVIVVATADGPAIG